MRIQVLLGGLAVLWAGAGILQPTRATLDLTTFQQPSETRTRGWGAGGVRSDESGSSNTLVPFEVTVFLDRESYRVGDELVFSVVLTSRSREPLVVPWQPDWRLVEKGHDKPPSGYATAVLNLTIDDQGAPIVLFSQSLFGSRLVEGSLQAVRPGESVRIVCRSKWDSEVIRPLLDAAADAQLTVRVGGAFHIVYPPDYRFLYLPSKSAEPVPVRLHK